jgi:hypothetical protein
MSFEYLQPGPWMTRRGWDYEATETALRNLLSEDKNYPYLQLSKANERYSLVALTTTDCIEQEKSTPSFKKTLASVELIHHVAKNLLRQGRIGDLKERLDGYVRPHYEMRKQLAQKNVRRNLMKEFNSVDKEASPVVAKEPLKTRPVDVKGAKIRTPSETTFRTHIGDMEAICNLIGQLSLDAAIFNSSGVIESAHQAYRIGSCVAGGPKSAFSKVSRSIGVEKGEILPNF